MGAAVSTDGLSKSKKKSSCLGTQPPAAGSGPTTPTAGNDAASTFQPAPADDGVTKPVVVSAGVSAAASRLKDSAMASEAEAWSSPQQVQAILPDAPYCGSAFPPNEPQRHAHLCNLGVLSTEPEQRFDDITNLCTIVFKLPIALVSLVDKDRQWFKSAAGLGASETDRKSSFCAWTLLPQHPEVLVVENALDDLRFSRNALVTGPPHIRFYAGCPLVASNKMRLGSLCVIDIKPRKFDAEQCNMLANMAEMVVREIEKAAMLKEQVLRSQQLAQKNEKLLRAIDCFSEGILICDLSIKQWPIVFVNEAWSRATQMPRDRVKAGQDFWQVFQLTDVASCQKCDVAIAKQQSFDLSVRFVSSSGNGVWVSLQFRCADNETMDKYMPQVGIPGSLDAPHKHTSGEPAYYFATATAASRNSMDVSQSMRSPQFSILHNKVDPFEDVTLGPMLGRGAYGRVYRGVWNGAQVAVKVLETLAKEDGSDLLEALLGEQVSHPNVVQTYKYCTRPGGKATDADNEGAQIIETWMVMEFCNKGSLSDATDKGAFRQKHSLFEVDWDSVLYAAIEIASAMNYLHARSVLHGDLTGNNVLLTTSQQDKRGWAAKVADFGLSRVFDGVQVITTKNYGTVTHMPPELLLDGTLTLASDVYAFGVIMWEMYSGTRPYSGMSHGQIIHHITSGKVLSLGSSCPSALRDFIRSCCSYKSVDRPTFPQVLKTLQALKDDLCEGL